jgi:pyridinium-3,5-biscarboxylic acid mononucleotide synthase
MTRPRISPDFVLDSGRARRIGFGEAVYCAGKSTHQLAAILEQADADRANLLLTRLDEERRAALPPWQQDRLDYDPPSRTAFFGDTAPLAGVARVVAITAGTSDVPVAREAARTLRFHGHASLQIADVGVAGIWRLMARLDEIREMPVVIVAAGMDAALPSVVAGLVAGVVIAVPTSVGYGVAAGGHAALNAILASCAPGIVTVNIDNGYGAACAAMRVLNALPAGYDGRGATAR